jgi:hypothetical protein
MLIGLIGQAQSGKDTAADYLIANLGYQKKSFVGRLKELCMELFDLTDDQVNTTKGKSNMDPRYNMTPRSILQYVGTETMRKIDNNVWIRNAMNQVTGDSCVVFCDVRFLNEVRAIKKRGGIVVKMIREDHQELSGKEAQHRSETEILNIPAELIDYTISAKTGQLDKIRNEILEIVNREIFVKEPIPDGIKIYSTSEKYDEQG